MFKLKDNQKFKFERFSIKATRWIGSIGSLVVHTIIFIGAFVLYFCGISLDTILLVLTTIVSLEAIYLAIFIQMSVNRHARKLKAVAQDVDEIQKDVDEIQEDVGEIQKDVDEIQEDVEDIQEEDQMEDKEEDEEEKKMDKIENMLGKLIEEVIELKKQHAEKK